MIRFAGSDGFKKELPDIAKYQHKGFPMREVVLAELSAKVTGRVMEIVEPEYFETGSNSFVVFDPSKFRQMGVETQRISSCGTTPREEGHVND